MRILLAVFISSMFLQSVSATQIQEKQFYDKAIEIMNNYRGDSSVLYEALYEITLIKQLNPNSKYYYTSYGEYQLKQGYISGNSYSDKAIVNAKTNFDKAIKIDPTFFDVNYYSFFVYLHSEDIKRARMYTEKLKKLAKSEDNKRQLNYTLAKLALKEKKYDKALKYSNKIINTTQDSSKILGALTILTEVYKEKKNYIEAQKIYKKIITIEPSAWAMYNLGNFYYVIKDYDKAIDYCKRALSVMNFPLARRVLGKAYYKKAAKAYWEDKWYQDALGYFEQSVKYYPSSNGYYGLGLSLYQVGYGFKNKEQILEAKKAFEYSLELDPDNKYSKKYLEKVDKLISWLNHNQ